MTEILHVTAETLRSIAEDAARSMRERTLDAIQPRWDLHPDTQHETERVIRALPLLPANSNHHGDALPAEDLVEPGDEVPALAELAGRVHALEEGAGSVDLLRQLDERVAAIEERLSPVDRQGMAAPAPAPAPARYRDRLGDVWEDQGDGTLRLIGVRADRREHLLTVLPHDVVEQRHGILARMPGGAR